MVSLHHRRAIASWMMLANWAVSALPVTSCGLTVCPMGTSTRYSTPLILEFHSQSDTWLSPFSRGMIPFSVRPRFLLSVEGWHPGARTLISITHLNISVRGIFSLLFSLPSPLPSARSPHNWRHEPSKSDSRLRSRRLGC